MNLCRKQAVHMASKSAPIGLPQPKIELIPEDKRCPLILACACVSLKAADDECDIAFTDWFFPSLKTIISYASLFEALWNA